MVTVVCSYACTPKVHVSRCARSAATLTPECSLNVTKNLSPSDCIRPSTLQMFICVSTFQKFPEKTVAPIRKLSISLLADLINVPIGSLSNNNEMDTKVTNFSIARKVYFGSRIKP